MKNKKIFFTSIIVPVFLLSSYAGADFDPTNSESREQIKTIMEKQKSWETLSSAEQEILTNMEANRKEFSWSGTMMWGRWWQMWQNMPELTQEQKTQMQEMKTLMDKKKNGETLTTEEQEKITQFESDKPMNEKTKQFTSEKTVTTTTWVNGAYKTQIDKKIKNISSQFSTPDEKIQGLENFSKKVENLQTQINNTTTFSETKKQTYNEILTSFLTLLQQEIDTLNTENNSTNDVSQLLESLFD